MDEREQLALVPIVAIKKNKWRKWICDYKSLKHIAVQFQSCVKVTAQSNKDPFGFCFGNPVFQWLVRFVPERDAKSLPDVGSHYSRIVLDIVFACKGRP